MGRGRMCTRTGGSIKAGSHKSRKDSEWGNYQLPANQLSLLLPTSLQQGPHAVSQGTKSMSVSTAGISMLLEVLLPCLPDTHMHDLLLMSHQACRFLVCLRGYSELRHTLN